MVLKWIVFIKEGLKAIMKLTIISIKLKFRQQMWGKQGIRRLICLIGALMSTIKTSLRQSIFQLIHRHRRVRLMGIGKWAWLPRLGRCKYSIISIASTSITVLLQRWHQKINKGKWVSFHFPWTTTTLPKSRTQCSTTALCRLKLSHHRTLINQELLTWTSLHPHRCNRPPLVHVS